MTRGARGARGAPRVFFAIIILLATFAACTLLNSLDEYGPPKAKPGEASTSSDSPLNDGGGIPENDGNPCQLVKWPPRPTTEDPGTGERAEIIFAAQTIDLSAPEDASTPVTLDGFDLDNVCTCPAPSSCAPPQGAKATCDLEGGIDNGGTALISTLAQLSQGSLDFNKNIRGGVNNLLMRLKFYNGGLNDSEVELSIFSSGGMEGVQTGTPTPPTFDGNDTWTVDSRSLVGGVAPPFIPQFADTKAYVANGMLVASIDFALRLSSVSVVLSAATLVAKIVRIGDKYFMTNGRLVGRWSTREFLTALETVKDPLDKDAAQPGGVCGASSFYQDLKKKICAGVDILADPKKDNTVTPCDALACMVVFTAPEAKLGNVFDLKPPIRRCGEGYSDDCDRQ